MRIAFLFICVNFFTNCFAQKDSVFTFLNKDEIESIQIKKVNPKNKTLQRELYLNAKQIEVCVDQINKSEKDSSNAMTPKYFLFITLKNKNIKYLSVKGNQLDAGHGACVSAQGNEIFFEKLYNSLME